MMSDYDSILERVYDNDFLIGVRDRFITLSIMAFLLDKEAWIYNTLIPIIEDNKLGVNTASIFHDYISSPNPDEYIIKPIKQIFVK